MIRNSLWSVPSDMLVATAQLSGFGLSRPETMSEPHDNAVTSIPETRALFLAHLVTRMAQGEQEAMSRLYDETSSLLNGLLVRMLGQAEDAEEILMDVYMRAWKKAASFSPERGSVQAWLVIMARSMAIDRIRHRKSQADTPTFDALELASLADPGASPETQTEDAHLRRQVAAVLHSLPSEQREVLELAFFSGFTHSELADYLGQPLGTVKSRIRMGLGRLRSLLDQNVNPASQGVSA